MRNPFKRQPRPAEKPSLRERAATLKSGLSRLLTRPAGQGEANQHRRALVAGSVAAAIPLPVLARTVAPAPVVAEALPLALPALVASPHPDQALLDLAASLVRVEEEQQRVSQANETAWKAVASVLNRRPIALVPAAWEWLWLSRMAPPYGKSTIGALRIHWAHDLTDLPEDDQRWQRAWTGEALRFLITNAVGLFGKGGQTPHYIRHWRELLPIADAFDAEVSAVEAATDCKRLSRAARDALERAQALRIEVEQIPATTPEGLAVHLRILLASDWYKKTTDHTAFVRSAAAITGVPLPESTFDVPAWIADWQRVGGRIEWIARRHGRDELALVYPNLSGANADRKAEVRRISQEQSDNRGAINRWFYDNR